MDTWISPWFSTWNFSGYFDVVIWFYWNSKDWKSLMDELSKSFFSVPYIHSGQILATSHDLTPKGTWQREIPLFQGNLGWWSNIIWSDLLHFCGWYQSFDDGWPLFWVWVGKAHTRRSWVRCFACLWDFQKHPKTKNFEIFLSFIGFDMFPTIIFIDLYLRLLRFPIRRLLGVFKDLWVYLERYKLQSNI